ncbi:hypothetical protein GCM10007049_26210 [Echinicola pacifica]|uniref:Chemotaxis methyl-accepting receptor HlyB-like 4HB MCP domain-containing protein n=1 Tax=Echinicola pacifica TaxID=346377 RepID=A0A918Q2X2_9BACT|nr:MCP four helix bundle domain-containing protein [Echinicola pacifica]GGZ31698.1 hypothetical protein GCM10007049_26210 [Echinicola pacifica]
MKWVYSIKNRLAIAGLLMVVFISVFVKNILDEENVSDLTISLATIYEDRLLPESYIYHLSDILNKKQRMLDDSQTALEFQNHASTTSDLNLKIDSILVVFEATHLTSEEAVALSSLTSNMQTIKNLEHIIIDGSIEDFEQAKGDTENYITAASEDLQTLSEIQLTVGKQVNDDSQRIMAGSSILTKFETALLIVLAIVINALIFGVVSSRSKIRQRANWN